jgi:hypothetical protein
MRRVFGWRRSASPPCPYVIVDKRCRMGWSCGDRCLCQQFITEPHVLDHAWMWLEGQPGHHVLTCEPYTRSLPPGALPAFRAALDRLGVEMTIWPVSYWHAHTTLLVCRRRGSPPLMCSETELSESERSGTISRGLLMLT